MDLEAIRRAVLLGKPLEDVLSKLDWKGFEGFVASVFEQHGFRVLKNFRIKGSERYELDVVASKLDLVLCIDCKEWNKGRQKRWSLRKAAERQGQRAKALAKLLRHNPVLCSKLQVNSPRVIPLIVTLFEEEVIREGKTYVVPAWKLNSFLLSF